MLDKDMTHNDQEQNINDELDNKWDDESLELQFNTSNRDQHRSKNKFSLKKIFDKKQKTKYDQENNTFSFKKKKGNGTDKPKFFSKDKFFKKDKK